MNDERWENIIKKAVEMEMESCPPPDIERIWRRIEHTIGLVDNSQKILTKRIKRRLWFKIAAAFSVLFFLCALITFTPVGEALPFGHVFQDFKKLILDDQIHIQFSYGEDSILKPSEPFLDLEVIEIGPAYTTFIETTIEELLHIYPNVLYYPQDISISTLKTVEYIGPLDHCNIVMDFYVGHQDILFRQRNAGEKGGVGMGFGAGTEVSLHRIDGVEYMVVEHRYGIVGVKWMKDGYFFELDVNSTVEEALSLAQSVKPYEH
ncbi:MAG: hypothetical protein Q7J85_08610 [Bacillota bacterium]|nr:hypothetical protein [Bacillota bacterium]